MNYIQYMQSGGKTENKKETSKFIEWLNKAGQSWKDFWDKPVTIQYAYNPHAVVGNEGVPFSSTQRRGDFATQAAGALTVPATAAGIATVGLPATVAGMGVGIGAGAVGSAGGSKLIELVGGDENAQEMVGDIAGFTLGAIAGGKATKATTNYLNFWNSQLSPRSIYTAMAEGMTPTTNQTYGLVKYYGPTMGKTTAARTNPKLVDFDDIVRGPIAELAAKKGVTPRDLKIANDPDYVSLLEAEVARWRMNPANADKTLVISNKALSSSTTGYNNQPSIPDKETFLARQVQRGGNREEAAAYYDALIENNPNLKIDNRFVSDIEIGTRSAKISEAERLGIPKGERNNAPRHLKKYADEYDRIILESEEITPKIKATLQDLVDKYYKHSVEFPIMSIDRPKYPMVFRHGSYNKFNIFDKKYFGISDGGYHGEGFYTSPTDFRIKNPTGNTIHGERAIYSAGRSRPYVYSLYLRNPKPYTITSNHGEGFSWFNRYPEGAIITNNGNSYFNGKHFTETIFTNPTQAKLADAIVVDDLGKIIPLRNRFKWNNPDMRYKSGGTIKIKKKNIGSFTRYCNGKVTEECIRKGKNSSNPTTRKRANFAWVARHKFKHEEGGELNYLNYFK